MMGFGGNMDIGLYYIRVCLYACSRNFEQGEEAQ